MGESRLFGLSSFIKDVISKHNMPLTQGHRFTKLHTKETFSHSFKMYIQYAGLYEEWVERAAWRGTRRAEKANSLFKNHADFFFPLLSKWVTGHRTRCA